MVIVQHTSSAVLTAIVIASPIANVASFVCAVSMFINFVLWTLWFSVLICSIRSAILLVNKGLLKIISGRISYPIIRGIIT